MRAEVEDRLGRWIEGPRGAAARQGRCLPGGLAALSRPIAPARDELTFQSAASHWLTTTPAGQCLGEEL